MAYALRLLIAAAVAAVIAVPSGASAHPGHCGTPFILSGVDAGDGNRAGTNPGGVSCTANDPDVHPDSNFTVPGAVHMWVGVFNTLPEPLEAFVTIGNGEPITLTWTNNTLRGRWESQTIDIAGVVPGTSISVTVNYGEPETITYTKI